MESPEERAEPVEMENPQEEEAAAGQEPAIMEAEEEQELLHRAGPSTRPDSPHAIYLAPRASSSQSSSVISLRFGPGNTVGQRVWNVWESGISGMGLSPCVLHRCLPLNIVCTKCENRKLAEKRAKEQGGPVDLAAQAAEGQTDLITVNFSLPRTRGMESGQSYPLTINREMTAHHVIKAWAGATNTEDFFNYTVMEYWKDNDAHRALDDCEKIYISEFEHRASRQTFSYSIEKNAEKYSYINRKKMYFITPKEAKKKFASISSNTDPDLIQVRHKFFHVPVPRLPRRNIRKKKGLKSFLSRSTSSDSEDPSQSTSPELRLEETDVPSESEEPKIPQADEANPIYCSTVYVRGGKPDSTIDQLRLAQLKANCKWVKRFLLLRDKTLYFVKDHAHMMKYYLMDDDEFEITAREKLAKRESRTLQLVGYTCQLDAYDGSSARYFYNCPFETCIYLRRHVASGEHPLLIMFCPKVLKAAAVFRAGPEIARNLWLFAIRISKFGEKIATDFLMYQRECMQHHVKLTCQADMAAKVPMDFSTGVGKLVPLDEAREDSPTQKVLRFEPHEQTPREAFANGVHLTQQYYHGNLSRQAAQAKLQVAGTNGSWLLRNSGSREHTLIISYIFEGRCFHKNITASIYVDQSSESRRERIFIATIDHVLAFYDVHSLLEFYRLNTGDELACMLGVSVKNLDQPNRSPERSRAPVRQLAAKKKSTGLDSGVQSTSSARSRVPPAEATGPSSEGSSNLATVPPEGPSSSEELNTEAAVESLSLDDDEQSVPEAN